LTLCLLSLRVYVILRALKVAGLYLLEVVSILGLPDGAVIERRQESGHVTLAVLQKLRVGILNAVLGTRGHLTGLEREGSFMLATDLNRIVV
jgi:hypothetical protein